MLGQADFLRPLLGSFQDSPHWCGDPLGPSGHSLRTLVNVGVILTSQVAWEPRATMSTEKKFLWSGCGVNVEWCGVLF